MPTCLWRHLLCSMAENGMSQIYSHTEKESHFTAFVWRVVIICCVKSGIWQEECASDFFSGSQNPLTQWAWWSTYSCFCWLPDKQTECGKFTNGDKLKQALHDFERNSASCQNTTQISSLPPHSDAETTHSLEPSKHWIHPNISASSTHNMRGRKTAWRSSIFLSGKIK